MGSDDSGVGYKRPPVATQFKPGCSGNPSGRPKKVRSLKDELLDELNESIRIQEGAGEVEISKARAIAKSLVHAAVGGNMRATTALLALFAKSLGETDQPQDQLATPEDTEILDDYIDRELRRRSNAGDTKVNNPQTDPESDMS
jgi:hypothetical protein